MGLSGYALWGFNLNWSYCLEVWKFLEVMALNLLCIIVKLWKGTKTFIGRVKMLISGLCKDRLRESQSFRVGWILKQWWERLLCSILKTWDHFIIWMDIIWFCIERGAGIQRRSRKDRVFDLVEWCGKKQLIRSWKEDDILLIFLMWFEYSWIYFIYKR